MLHFQSLGVNMGLQACYNEKDQICDTLKTGHKIVIFKKWETKNLLLVQMFRQRKFSTIFLMFLLTKTINAKSET